MVSRRYRSGGQRSAVRIESPPDVPRDLLGPARADRALGLGPGCCLGDPGEHGLPTGFAGPDPGDRQQRGRDRGAVPTHEPIDQLDVLGGELHRRWREQLRFCSAGRTLPPELVAGARAWRGGTACARRGSSTASVKPPLRDRAAVWSRPRGQTELPARATHLPHAVHRGRRHDNPGARLRRSSPAPSRLALTGPERETARRPPAGRPSGPFT